MGCSKEIMKMIIELSRAEAEADRKGRQAVAEVVAAIHVAISSLNALSEKWKREEAEKNERSTS